MNTVIGIQTQVPDFEKLKTPNFLRRLEYRTVLEGARSMRDSIREALISKVPKATARNPKYNDTLADAVLLTKSNMTNMDRCVHALGTRESGSGTYRARFFNAGTKERYQKTYRGQKLKKKKHAGRIEPTNFFSIGVNQGKSKVQDTMIRTAEKIIQNYINNNIK